MINQRKRVAFSSRCPCNHRARGIINGPGKAYCLCGTRVVLRGHPSAACFWLRVQALSALWTSLRTQQRSEVRLRASSTCGMTVCVSSDLIANWCGAALDDSLNHDHKPWEDGTTSPLKYSSSCRLAATYKCTTKPPIALGL